MTSYNSTSCAHAQLKQLGTCQWHNYQTVPRAFEAEGAVVSSSSVERGGGEVGGEEWKERRKRGTCGGSRLRRWSLEKRPCSARMKGLNATQRSGSGLRIPPLSLPSYFSFLFFSFLSFFPCSLLPLGVQLSSLQEWTDWRAAAEAQVPTRTMEDVYRLSPAWEELVSGNSFYF